MYCQPSLAGAENDTAGSLTIRSLRCACRIRLHPLYICPVHSDRPGAVIVEYLEARGIKTCPTLALIAADRDVFMAQVVQPLLDGYRTGTREFTLAEEEKPIAAAVLEHNMWSEAALQWQRRQSSMDCASGHGCGRPSAGTTRTIQRNLLREDPKTISCSSLAEADFEVQRHHGGWKASEIPRETSARGGADLREDFHGIWGGQPFSRSPSSSSGG